MAARLAFWVVGSYMLATDSAIFCEGWPSASQLVIMAAALVEKGVSACWVGVVRCWGLGVMLVSREVFERLLNNSVIALRARALASGWLRWGQLDHRWVTSPHPQQARGCLVLDALARACSAMLAQIVH